ncbi:unnamed protein product, partial [Mesorhabditis belari]|uniref:NSFL1 cofactor p47 n=1 Tax=Mesorhabditis belari TaxID=2138241 RepID=A0AAF3FC18_9BILA
MPNIRTLHDNKDDEGSGSESEGENRRQGFYVGGSETSGQQVLGPPGRDRREGDFAQNFFDAARRAGAEAVTGEAAQRRGNQPRGAQVDENAEEGQNTREICLTMWANGFSVEDGPLRSFDDAANQAFLQEIMRGHIPMELRRQYPTDQLELRMERKLEDYTPPKPKPFGGSGHRLGAVVPEVVSTSSAATTSSSATSEPSEDLTAKAQAEVKLDEGAPITQVQARMPSGSRLVGRFNHSHIVADVRSFLVSASPDLAFAPFRLMTTFPNKVIEDESQSLKDAGLINAVVVVKPNL